MPTTSSNADPSRQWFILANGSRAQAYVKRKQDSGYDELRVWDAPEARMRDADLGEERPGRAFASARAMQRSAMERDGKDDGPKEHARRDFLEGLAHDGISEFAVITHCHDAAARQRSYTLLAEVFGMRGAVAPALAAE